MLYDCGLSWITSFIFAGNTISLMLAFYELVGTGTSFKSHTWDLEVKVMDKFFYFFFM